MKNPKFLLNGRDATPEQYALLEIRINNTARPVNGTRSRKRSATFDLLRLA
jgi:hypothetical protein